MRIIMGTPLLFRIVPFYIIKKRANKKGAKTVENEI